MPKPEISTIVSMVEMVAIEKTPVTIINPEVLCLAAGYMRSGISGSQGPKMKIVKRIHGVIFCFRSACT